MKTGRPWRNGECGIHPPPTPENRNTRTWFGALQAADPAGFVHAIVGALRDMPHDTHTIVLSTEGIFNHWWDYAPLARALLRDLAPALRLRDVHLLPLRRIRSPPPSTPSTCATLRAMTRHGTCTAATSTSRRRCATSGFANTSTISGSAARPRHCSGKAASDRCSCPTMSSGLSCAVYDIDGPSGSPPRENESLSSAGVEMMRIANRLELSVPEQQRVEGLVRDIDRVIGSRSTEFRLEENDARLVQRYAARGWRTLRSG